MPPQRLHPEHRKAQLVDTTRRLIVERGMAALATRDVTAAARVSPGLLHYHFDSFDALLAAAFRQAAQDDLADVAERLDGIADPRAALAELLALFTPRRSDATLPLWLEAWAYAVRSPDVRQVCRALSKQWHEALAGVARRGVAAGVFRCPRPDVAAWQLLAVLDGLAVDVVVTGLLTAADYQEIAQDAADRLLGT